MDLQRKKIIQEQTEETEEITIRGNEMEIEEVGNLPKLFISPIEKLMDEFNGSVKEFKALFKVPKTNTPIRNLHQQVCHTSKSQFDLTNGDCSLCGLDFSQDEQIVNWIQKTNGRY